MSDQLTDKEKMQVQAETASANRKKAKGLYIKDVLARVKRQDGVGLTPAEVWRLYEEIFILQHALDLEQALE